MKKRWLVGTLALVMLLAMVGCGGGDAPTRAFDAGMTALKKLNEPDIVKYFYDGEEGIVEDMQEGMEDFGDKAEDIMKAYYGRVSWKVKSSEIDPDDETVAYLSVEISYPDMDAAITSMTTELMTWYYANPNATMEKVMDKSAELMSGALKNAEIITETVEAEMWLEDGQWQIYYMETDLVMF